MCINKCISVCICTHLYMIVINTEYLHACRNTMICMHTCMYIHICKSVHVHMMVVNTNFALYVGARRTWRQCGRSAAAPCGGAGVCATLLSGRKQFQSSGLWSAPALSLWHRGYASGGCVYERLKRVPTCGDVFVCLCLVVAKFCVLVVCGDCINASRHKLTYVCLAEIDN